MYLAVASETAKISRAREKQETGEILDIHYETTPKDKRNPNGKEEKTGETHRNLRDSEAGEMFSNSRR